jgi:prophage DNA circulation protein
MGRQAGWYNQGKRRTVSEASFFTAVFALIEFLAKTTLTTTSKKLILNYIAEASDGHLVGRARSAIRRYMQTEVPSLDEIREKSKTEELSKIDHLVLKMEYEATRVPESAL